MAINYFTANPDVAEAYQSNSYGLSPQEFADAHYSIYGAEEARAAPVVLDLVSQGNLNPTQIAATTGIPVNEVIAQVASTVAPNQAVLLGDTWVQAINQVTGSGMDQQIGGLEAVSVYKTTGGVNDKVPVGTPIQNYTPTGELISTSQITSSGQTSFFGGLVEALKDPVVLAALAGGYGAGLFGGTGALGGAATVGTTGLTATQLAQLDMALGGLGGFGGATGGSALATALTTGAAIPTISSLTGGSGLLTSAPITPASVATKLATDAELLNAGAGAFTPTTLTPVNTTPLITPTPIVPPVVATPPVVTPPSVTPPPTVTPPPVVTPPVVTPPVVTPPIVTPTVIPPVASTLLTSLLPTAVKNILTPTTTGNLFNSGLSTVAGLLQQQTSKEAADKARLMIEQETAAAKQAAAFRPIGMTTRFGSSQFVTDPVTGRLTSAGYTLSPEAKAQQDRFVALSNAGLTQAEAAQQQFAPLQTGAQNLFNLGNQYIAKTPESVAQNYLNQQMALLKPGRELELANLQNRLQQQGRGGLSVAQGGTMGATTPELQALFNARAQQEAQLAANAQQAGQQQVLYGAGLLGQGSQAMGQYYGGQQQAYAPFTSAFGQMQALESAAQQPFQLGVGLGKETSTAGYNVGRLGLTGAGQSVALATGADATRNPYASALSGAAANPMFGQVVGGLFGSQPATSGFSYGQYGTGIDPSTGEYFGSLYF